ncbi:MULTISPECIES: SDR family oxidoreductase [Staphylococcus]|uniref:SDR family oxidoreductase n=1 Tax=Staphylococcus TaxID=1279 RepID=UPI001E640DDF|nr:SDR family oxidoreductase [Staphylococcus arlettae]MCD8815422.1 SDR family oxidoreductase [Staphylococcus arlettae]
MSKLNRERYPLKGKKVLITGVSRRQGIGYAIARQSAAWGASIIVHHYQPHDKEQEWGADDLSKVLNNIEKELIDDAFLYDVSGDFREQETPNKIMKMIIEKCGSIDALVCNHALSGSDGAIGELSAEMLDKHWAVNTRSTILLAQSFAEQYENQLDRGNIIFLTSGQRLGPMPGEVAYASAKGALADITMTISDQLADKNISVNTVNPGPVDTGYLNQEMWNMVKPMFPFGRYGHPEDPARLVVWLLTEEASWITGQIINTEGGFGRWRSRNE